MSLSKKEERLYQEIEQMGFIFYVTDEKISDGKIHLTDIRDKTKTTDSGKYPWYKGAFGNCLISLKYSKVTDKLYLLSEDNGKKMYSEGFIYKDMIERIELLEKYADKIITREDL